MPQSASSVTSNKAHSFIIKLMKFPAFLFSFLIFGFLLLFLVQGFLAAREREGRLTLLQQEVSSLSAKVKEKEGELAYRQSPEYIEKAAREQLGWAKPGETIVVLPDLEEKKPADKTSAASNSTSTPSSPIALLPYWKQWRVIFFGN